MPLIARPFIYRIVGFIRTARLVSVWETIHRYRRECTGIIGEKRIALFAEKRTCTSCRKFSSSHNFTYLYDRASKKQSSMSCGVSLFDDVPLAGVSMLRFSNIIRI